MDIKKCLFNLNLPLKKCILLESNPDYSDNTKYVYNELLKRKINLKYKIIWFVNNRNDFSDIEIKNVIFLNRYKNFFSKLRFKLYNYTSKYIIDCNKYIIKKNKNQFRIFLCHGMPMKLVMDYGSQSGIFDYMISTSDFFNKYISKIYNVEENKIIVTGAPRNDAIFNSERNNIFSELKRRKTIIWMPTYRNHFESDTFEGRTNIKSRYGIPCIENENQIETLNSILKQREMLLIIKLHPVEDRSNIEKLNLSNIKLLDNEYLEKKRKTIYDYLNNIDALITDYSSIYYDFLLTKKQIGLAIPDLKEYTKHVPFCFENYKKYIEGEYLYTFDDIVNFIINVSENIDIKKDKRIELMNKYHKYIDGDSSKRIVDIIEKKMKEG